MLDSVRGLALSLQHDHGVTPEILSFEDEYSTADLAAWASLPVHLFPPKGPRVFRYSPDVGACLDHLDPVLAHTFGLWTFFSIATRQWSRRRGAPYLVTPQGMLDAWALHHSGWKKRIAGTLFERSHLEGAACLHAVCESEAAAMRAYGLKNPISIIPNGVTLPALREECRDKFAFEDQVPAGSKVLLYLGRLHPKKGLANLLRAWATVAARNRSLSGSWVLLIAGWDQGGHLQELQALAAELEVAASVRFIGPLFAGAKAAALYRADAFVLPSLSEGLPLTVLEAWAHGLPVIMTPACNLPEGFAAGAAISAEPQPSSLAAALTALFEASDTERHNMGSHGRALVEQKFTWPQAARQMRAVYDWILGGGSAPGTIAG